jgi:glyoxylate reductase
LKPKIFITRRIPDQAFLLLKKSFEVEGNPENRAIPSKDIAARLKDKDGLYCFLTDRIDRETIQSGPALKAIANFAVGYNNIDVEAAAARGIIVTNTPDVLTETTADLTWTLIFSVARHVPAGDRFVREKQYVEWDPFGFLGLDVHGAVLGIIGFGRIGQAVAARSSGFGMRILYHDANPSPALFSHKEALRRRMAEGGIRYSPLEDLVRISDIITIHAPLTPETRHIMNRQRLYAMKAESILVNTSRGPLIDEEALIDLLAEKKIFGAGLDVYEHEPRIPEALAALDNVTLLPHVGSATRKTRLAMAMLAAENLVCALTGQDPPNRVV